MNEYENADKKQQDIINKINDYNKEEIGDISGETDSENPEIPDEDKNEIIGGAGEGENPIVDEDGLATEDTTIVAKDDPNVQIVIPKGFAPAILETGRTDSMPGENGAVKSIMPKEQWNSITKEDINKGIVVVDNAITYTGSVSDFNEYVWIPIPDMSKFVRGWSDYLGDETNKEEHWEETSSTEYKYMELSVRDNKGFYISRYEASQKNGTTAQSKRKQNTWNVSQIKAIEASSNMKPEINSHLIYGVEWDSILTWLLDSKAKIGADILGELLQTITKDDIQSDSRSWGNYYDSIGGAAMNSGSKQLTGTNEYWKANNIYDMAGNVYEWTQEKYREGAIHVLRGCCYNDDGLYMPVAYRNYGDDRDTSERIQSSILCVIINNTLKIDRIAIKYSSIYFLIYNNTCL